MVTLKQLLANRINALKSTGPRSDEGKRRAASNALKHGLSRLGSLPPAELADAIADRKEQWFPDYQPRGPSQSWHFERLCGESVRLDFCERRLLAARAEHAGRAAESWDDDRAAEVAAVASKLADRPEEIQPKLLQSKHGVQWMLDRWEEIAAALGEPQNWTPTLWNRALDLLGLPTDTRGDAQPSALADEGSGPALNLVRDSMAALRQRLETVLEQRDAQAQADTEAGLSPGDSPEVRRLERYASDARRRFTAHLSELRRLQNQSEKASPPPSRFAHLPAPPGPRPERAPRTRPVATTPPPAAPEPAPSANPAETTPPPAVAEPAKRSLNRPGQVAMVRDSRWPPEAPRNRRERRAQAAERRRRRR